MSRDYSKLLKPSQSLIAAAETVFNSSGTSDREKTAKSDHQTCAVMKMVLVAGAAETKSTISLLLLAAAVVAVVKLVSLKRVVLLPTSTPRHADCVNRTVTRCWWLVK
jgi:hypothetical protein